MSCLRRVLAPLTAIWLFCQVGTVALAPVALWISAADPHGSECTCGHGAGAMCPMHHKPAAPTNCAMQTANPPGSVLTTLVSIAGLIPEPTLSVGPSIPSMSIGFPDVYVTTERPIPPDPPPPRA